MPLRFFFSECQGLMLALENLQTCFSIFPFKFFFADSESCTLLFDYLEIKLVSVSMHALVNGVRKYCGPCTTRHLNVTLARARRPNNTIVMLKLGLCSVCVGPDRVASCMHVNSPKKCAIFSRLLYPLGEKDIKYEWYLYLYICKIYNINKHYN